ncbi:CDP-diacylglycerol--glycerol-3-phosphate 3-phosphatidyltransferase [Entomomonas moraniae]|uniref:CDP-diacylglycerol--glycerol-3-phosphate 3-phosphatidyltransferase n=1 Tax=Entomomonas moraniae TaxID=2213226 RepID=A0A3Q9JMT8_9GAMM|nr:CDP-diacylglycerol--glycerol-3-phosphate 3-phosphatidyltransferase [Entomomonas moraniae]AZS49904.1 CDP-diacylglycerol--glycerol-3-phosphate 3-phosphatidyltransferase [Entomomonas moraniae]
MNIPNILTMLRVVLIPIFVIIYLLPFPWVYTTSSVIFAIACITDWFDGYLARQWNQTTPFGAFLDPVADKLIVAVALVLLVGSHSRVIHGTMVNLCLTLSAIIIVSREIVVSALREWMAELGARANVAVSKLGKWKTAAQMIALVILLANPPILTTPVIIGYVLLTIAAVLTIWSMIHYLMAAWPYLMTDNKNKIEENNK